MFFLQKAWVSEELQRCSDGCLSRGFSHHSKVVRVEPDVPLDPGYLPDQFSSPPIADLSGQPG